MGAPGAAQIQTEWRHHRPAFRDALQYLAFVAVYILAEKMGFRAAFVAEQVSPVWPPAGLALWAVLHFGIWAAPAVWLGSFIANATTHVPIAGAFGIALGVAATALIRR